MPYIGLLIYCGMGNSQRFGTSLAVRGCAVRLFAVVNNKHFEVEVFLQYFEFLTLMIQEWMAFKI